MIAKLREQRAAAGVARMRKFCEMTGYPLQETAIMATVLTASVTYLVMLEDFCPVYNGIAINQDSGWEQISNGMELI